MVQGSNLITLPGISAPSTRPTLPPPESGEALATPQLDSWGKVAFSVTKGIAAAAEGGGPKGTSWLAGFVVAVGLLMTAALGWMTVEMRDMRGGVDEMGEDVAEVRDVVDGMRTDNAAQVQAQIVRDTAQDVRLDAVVDAVLAIHDEQRASGRWTQRILLDNWIKQNPDREPPTPPDTNSNDRIFLNLR